jgi:peptidoglycan/LPS O-acetylase OafA/YrhL
VKSVLPTETRPRRLGMLDALRFLAALSVVAFHYTARNNPGWNGPPPESLAGVGQWASYGRLGVPLFFVISGFVVLMSAWGKDVQSFFASRIGRLFPAYWVAVTFSIVLVLYVWPENPDFLGHPVTTSGAFLNYTMVHNAFGVPDVDGPYWTLWYEARFYALIAVLLLIGITRVRVLAFCALWPIVGAVATAGQSAMLTAVLMPDYAPFFAGGMLLYLVYRDGHDLGTWLLIGLQVAIAVNFTANVYPELLTLETPWVPSKAVIALATVACFGLVAVVTLTRVAHVNARWMVVAGALTYPLYLVHENLGWYVIHLTHDEVGAWTAVLFATVAALSVSVALHQLVEKPFGHRLRTATLAMFEQTRRERVPAAGASAPAAVEHVATEHVATEHVATEHVTTEHVTTEHVTTEHVTTGPAATRSAGTRSVVADASVGAPDLQPPAALTRHVGAALPATGLPSSATSTWPLVHTSADEETSQGVPAPRPGHPVGGTAPSRPLTRGARRPTSPRT